MATAGDGGTVWKGLCETCLFTSKKTASTLFCVDCKECLCDECGTAHRIQRLSRHHTIVDKSDGPPEEVIAQLSVLVACPLHKSEDVVYICRDHDQTCCSQCANTVHRKCDKLDVIEDLIEKDAGTSKEFKFAKELKRLSDFVKGMRSHEINHKKAINDSVGVVSETVNETCRVLANAVDALKDSITLQTQRRKEHLLKAVESNLELIKDLEEDISTEINHHDLIAKHGRRIHIYLLDRRLKRMKLPAMKKKAIDLHQRGNKCIVSCTKITRTENVIENIRSSLGIQTIVSETSSRSLQTKPHYQHG